MKRTAAAAAPPERFPVLRCWDSPTHSHCQQLRCSTAAFASEKHSLSSTHIYNKPHHVSHYILSHSGARLVGKWRRMKGVTLSSPQLLLLEIKIIKKSFQFTKRLARTTRRPQSAPYAFHSNTQSCRHARSLGSWIVSRRHSIKQVRQSQMMW